MALKIQIDEVPATGQHLKGRLDQDIFGLQEDAVRYLGPLDHDLTAFLQDGVISLTGKLEAPFELLCTRCLTPFPFTVQLLSYSAEIDAENAPIVDLTDQVREDILLALPGYPKCEQATGASQVCPAAGHFESQEKGGPGPGDGESTSEPSHWDILDQLPTTDEQDS